VLAFAAAAYLLAAPLTNKLRFDSRAERIAIRSALGLGLLSYLVMALSLSHLLEPLVLVGVLGLLVVAAVLRLRRLERALRRARRRPAIGAALAALLLLAGSWLALYPTTSHDAVLYHLPAARLHIEENALAYSPHIRLNFVPQLWELLYTAALLVSDEVVANLLHYLALCLIVVMLFALGRRFFGAWVGAWAAALFLANPIGIAIAPAANNDLALALFCLTGLAAAGAWLETHQERWLAVSGLLLGFAASTKYTGLVFLGLAGLGVIAVSLRRRRLWPALTFLALAGLRYVESGDARLPVSPSP
jgi:hypothetical protein